jgi:hypothetical protein
MFTFILVYVINHIIIHLYNFSIILCLSIIFHMQY